MGGVPNGAMTGTGWSLSRTAARVRVDIAFAITDVVVVGVSYSMALAVRMLDPLVGDAQAFWLDLFIALPLIATIHVVANAIAGAYGHVWEHASTTEAMRLALANGAAIGVILTLSWLLREPVGLVVPFLTLAAGGVFSFLLMGLVRYRSRLFSFRRRREGPRILVVGDSSDAAAFARRMATGDGAGLVIGFVNDERNPGSASRLLAELPVLGSVSDIPSLVISAEIDEVVVAGKDPELIRSVVDRCLEVDVRLRVFPGISDVLRDDTAPLDVRDIRVEDLLIREQVASDMSRVSELLAGKTVLVTGGGGSIGAELVRQVMRHAPGAVWAMDHDETLLHEAQLGWEGKASIVLADVRDALATLRAMERIQPDVIFHAAALKHVPVLEDHPEEAVLTNVIGTRNIIEAGSRVGVQRFVLISTDKAVDPTSVMGASKRVAELLVKAGEARQDDCIYTAVRFGNVLGSRGSVIPTFVSQIRTGGPVTVTDAAMRRFFMTVDESVQLVLQAAALARGSEVFLLDMGDPVKIDDLARRLIRLAGLIPDVDVKIEYTGIRPGEKLEESLATGPLDPTSNPQVFEVRLAHPEAGILAAAVEDLEDAALAGDRAKVIALLNSLASGRLQERQPSTKLVI